MTRKSVLLSALAHVVAMPVLAQPPSAEAPAQPAARAEVLVFGVYLMPNTGRDMFNMKTDDVLALPIQTAAAPRASALKMSVP